MAKREMKYIFIDFFNTVVFRRITANQALERWIFCMKRKFPELKSYENGTLLKYRKASFSEAGETIREPRFSSAMEYMYGYLPELSQIDYSFFCKTAEVLDLAIEYGCQYPNWRLIQKLLRLKAQGKKIICVSDFYHDSGVLRGFLKNCNVSETLFDYIFVSCECGVSKAKGTMYPYVLDSLRIENPAEVLMIGDNFLSDKIWAKRAGITAVLKRHLLHKSIGRIKQKVHYDYSTRQMKDAGRDCYKNGYPFSEYILIFYVFIRRLSAALQTDGVQCAAFIAREGWYLKKLYEKYSEICIPMGQEIGTEYLKCSRRSIFSGISEEERKEDEPISLRNWLKSLDLSAEDIRKYISITDAELDEICPVKRNPGLKRLLNQADFREDYNRLIQINREMTMRYMRGFLDDGRLNIIDSGWKGTIQEVLYQYYHISSTGYYIGTQDYPGCPKQVVRRGLIFEEPDGGFYDYVGMNFPFYQQLLAAPHGSAVKYYFDSGEIRVKEVWDELERTLYEKWIFHLQEHMLTRFMGLSAWNDNLTDGKEWLAAKTVFHSNMFVYGERLEFAKDCENSFLINFQQEKRGAKNYDYKKVPLKLDIFVKPEKYIRYITKIQRSRLYSNKIVRVLYPGFAKCFYVYTLLLHYIKEGGICPYGIRRNYRRDRS